MRIVGGKHKGRTLDWPKTRLVRPMSELVREALFNILGPLDGMTFLDAYAGSGAVGLEAISRGAERVEGVEILAQAAKSIRHNLASLGLNDHYHLRVLAIEKWVETNTVRFDIIVAGPPFTDLNNHVLDKISNHLEPDGIMVVWHTSRIDPPELKSVGLTDSRRYGDSTLSFYHPKKTAESNQAARSFGEAKKQRDGN